MAARQDSVTLDIAVREVLGTTMRGGAVFSGTAEVRGTVRVVATPEVLPRPPQPGEAWAVTGVFTVHPKYGRQLEAHECRYRVPVGRLLVRYLADSPHFEGVGESKAKALWEALGEELAPALTTGDFAALEAVLTPLMSRRLVEAWQARLPEAEAMVFLDAHGFDLRLAAKLVRIWGGHTLQMLEANPYHLLAFASWKHVDAAARQLGAAAQDPRRLVGAVESALYDRLLQAHTVTPHQMLLRLSQRKLGGPGASTAVPLALAELAVVGTQQTGYQTTGAAALERGIEARLRAMVGGELAQQGALFLGQPTQPHNEDWSQEVIAAVERAQKFPLNKEQRLGVTMPFQHAFSLLTGGAGVGKTTVLRVVLQLAQQRHLRVYQMALAGRAAKRMSESTGSPASTIAKFLKDAKAGRTQLTADSLLVVDESSMLDLPTFYQILRYVPEGARVLLVGDPAQLPPIGFGLVFHRLVDNVKIPQTHLVEVHRQAASTGIPAVAEDVRAHRLPSFVPFSGKHPGVSFIECDTTGVIDQLRGLADIWQAEDWQVLSAVKGGRGGVDNINATFHAEAAGGSDAQQFVSGEPVIHLVNDFDRGLMNGTLGRVVEIHADGMTVEFEGELHRFGFSEIPERLQHAYAISVHKAQGSQFNRVAVVVGRSRILDHALIYTGLTRGVEQVVFVGDRAAFELAVRSPPLAQSREVAFNV